ncbi:MAG: M15 family metallopeptidase [bacterium]|nr:M15 family metallopeptidase [bacterium]
MSNFKLSKTSIMRLQSCHEDLQRVIMEAIKTSPIDFGISCGHRSVEEQQKLYAQGRTQPGAIVTKVDGIKVKSKHNYCPSKAVDIYAYVDGGASWEVDDLLPIVKHIMNTAVELFSQGRIEHNLRSGGDWDRDGEYLTDQGFDDLPHIEIV